MDSVVLLFFDDAGLEEPPLHTRSLNRSLTSHASASVMDPSLLLLAPGTPSSTTTSSTTPNGSPPLISFYGGRREASSATTDDMSRSRHLAASTNWSFSLNSGVTASSTSAMKNLTSTAVHIHKVPSAGPLPGRRRSSTQSGTMEEHLVVSNSTGSSTSDAGCAHMSFAVAVPFDVTSLSSLDGPSSNDGEDELLKFGGTAASARLEWMDGLFEEGGCDSCPEFRGAVWLSSLLSTRTER